MVESDGLSFLVQIVEDYKHMAADKANQNRLAVHRLDVLEAGFSEAVNRLRVLLKQQCDYLNQNIKNVYRYSEGSELSITNTETDDALTVSPERAYHRIIFRCENPVQYEKTLQVKANDEGSQQWFTYGSNGSNKKVRLEDFEKIVPDAINPLLGRAPQRW